MFSEDGAGFRIFNDASITPGYNGTASGSTAWTGNRTPWEIYTADLTRFVGHTVQFRFAISSDASTNGQGWYIDEVIIQEAPPTP